MPAEVAIHTAAPSVAIAVIGAGRAGCQLVAALAAAGVADLTLVCRDAERRARVATWLAAGSTARVVLRPDLAGLAASTVVLAVPDRDLAECARALAEITSGNGQIWLHLSGVTAAAVLRVPGCAAAVGSLHPLCALPDPLAPGALQPRPGDPGPLGGALMALGGDPAARVEAARIARLLGGVAVQVADAARPAYHAAAAIVANDLAGLIDIGAQLCRDAGLPARAARQGLLHLARTALAALERLPPDASLAHGLTGAVARGDAPTLARHLEVLEAAPEAREIHRLLSARLVELVRSAGTLDARQLAELECALSGGGVRDDRP